MDPFHDPGGVVKQNVIWSRARIVLAAFQALGGYDCSAFPSFFSKMLMQVGSSSPH
jgi:hypothetical protein